MLIQELAGRQLESLWVVLDGRDDSESTNTEESRINRLLFTSEESNLDRHERMDPEETLSRFTGHCDAHNFPFIITN